MTRLRNIIVELLFVTCIAAAAVPRCAADEVPSGSADRSRTDLVVVSIRPNVKTDSRVIRLVDVATVTGGDAAFRERIKQLDLEDGVAAGESLTILPPQIEFRMRLAGIDIDRVSIKGGGVRVTSNSGSISRGAQTIAGTSTHGGKLRREIDFSAISVDDGPLEHEIVQSAKDCILKKLPWAPEDVDIRLAQPVPAEIRQISSAAGYECAAEMRTSGPAVGRVQVRVIASAPQKPLFDVAVILDVRHFDRVVMTTKAIDRGHVLTATDLYADRCDVTELSDYCSKPGELIGATARRSVRALMPVRMSDVEGAVHSEGGILVKRRDHVKMVARVGVLSVAATGEALQEGRLGETIRLRNTESNATVQGRVTSAGEVEISF